jgi:DNA repair exonuclease SbcCD ATPase subunit
LNLHKITFKNILSYGNSPIEIELDNNLLNLIYGTNGNGKSTLLESVFYVLTGKTYRDIKLSQLINTTNKKNLLVTLEASNKGKRVVVSRGMKPKIFEIEVDGNKIDEDSKSTDFQAELERLLGFNSLSLKQNICLNADFYKPFIKMSAQEKRTYIEDILNIQVFSEMNKLIKQDLSVHKENMRDTEADYKRIQSNLEIIHEMNKKILAQQTKSVDEIKKQLSGRIEEYDALILNYDESYVEKNSAIDEKKKEIAELDSEIEDLKSELEKIKENNNSDKIKSYIEELKNKKSKCKEKYAGISKANSALGKISALKDTKQTFIAFLKENDSCPTCKQEITLEHKNSMSESIQNEFDQLNKKKDEIKEKIRKYETLSEKIEKIDIKIQELNEKYNKYLYKIREKETELNNKISKTRDIEKSIDYLDRNKKNILNDIDNIKIKIKQTIEEINNVKEPEKKELRDDSELIKELSDIKLQYKDMEKKKRIFDISVNLLSDKGIKSYIVRKYIPILNTYVNKYLEILQAPYRMKFNELLEETIVLKGYETLSYGSFSKGERSRCDLALMFAFLELSKKKNSVNTNILFLDEILDTIGLDKQGIVGFISILKSFKENGYTIFCISHKEEVKNYFDRHYEVKKKKFSLLEQV